MQGEHALIVEVAPGLAIERVTDLALRAVPAVEPGILFVERQFGVLEVHGGDLADVQRAGQAILAGLRASAADQLQPRILFTDVIEDVTDRQAVIINRNRSGSMLIPGETLLVCEVTPALFAAVAANEAERAAPGVTLVNVAMIGVAGGIYMSGPTGDILRAQQAIADVLGEIEGREHELPPGASGPGEPNKGKRICPPWTWPDSIRSTPARRTKGCYPACGSDTNGTARADRHSNPAAASATDLRGR